MLTIAWYLVKVMLCSGILFAYYLLALRNKKFHLYNRLYLLASIAFSWFIPLMKIGFWEETTSQPVMVNLLAVVAKGDRLVEQADQFEWNWNIVVIFLFALISSLFFAQLVITVVKINRLIRNNPTKKWNDIKFVFTNAKGTPFSFFKYIFWNEQIDLNSAEGEQILKHELTHVHQNHSVDKVLVSIVLIIGWFNPFIWLIRKELNMIHEFIADKKAVNEGDFHSFAKMLLTTAYPQYSFPLTNTFFYSPAKRRLLMLTSSKKTSFTYLRRLAILPLLVFTCILFAFTVKKAKTRLDDGGDLVRKETSGIKDAAPEPFVDPGFQDTTKKNKRNISIKTTRQRTIEIIPADTTSTGGKVEINVAIDNKDTGKLKKPLVVVDGKQMTWQQFEKNELKPEQIESMNVFSGETAIKKYGEKGKDGVIEISSKRSNAETSVQQKKLNEQENLLKAQQNDAEKAAKYDKVFTRVENPPYYPKGMIAFAEYITSNVRYPKEALQNKIEGAVLIQFIVNEEGKLTDFKKVSDKGYGLEDEAIRLLKNSGDWKPGIQNGHKVPVQIQQQVIFELPKKS